MEAGSKIYIAGHLGMVGSAIWRNLTSRGHKNLVGRSIEDLDLTDRRAVDAFFADERPEYVFLAAAKVGGIQANDRYRADFIYENLAIQTNVIDAAYKHGVKKLLFLGSSCIYPRQCQQPIKEEYLLTGPLEPTNEPYAIAKIAGLKMCESYNRQHGAQFLSVMPTNLYGPNDNFDLNTSHVLPALIRKFTEGKRNHLPFFIVWGTGKPRREFLHVDDAADAFVYLMRLDTTLYAEMGVSHVNVGCGVDKSIAELAEIVREATGYEGDIRYDVSKPDGMPQKLLDISRLSGLGWRARTDLHDGIRATCEWYKNNRDTRES